MFNKPTLQQWLEESQDARARAEQRLRRIQDELEAANAAYKVQDDRCRSLENLIQTFAEDAGRALPL